MRNKIVLIRGARYTIAPEITIGEYERINADHVVLMTALRRPQLLPSRDLMPDIYYSRGINPETILNDVVEILDYWQMGEHTHFLASEYANIAVDHGIANVKVVEGFSLKVSWFYDVVRSFHRNHNQKIIEVVEDADGFIIENKIYTQSGAIDLLKHPSTTWLG